MNARIFAAGALLSAALTLFFYVLESLDETAYYLGIGLAVGVLLLSIFSILLEKRIVLFVLLLIWVLQFGVFISYVSPTAGALSFRLLATANLILYGTMALSAVLSMTWLLASANALLVSGSLALALFLFEVWFESDSSLHPVDTTASALDFRMLEGGVEIHPVIGEYYYTPFTSMRVYYPSNPRGYFTIEPGTRVMWGLHVIGAGNQARLVVPNDDDQVLVEIDSAERSRPHGIILYKKLLPLRYRDEYLLTFRARADVPSHLQYGIVTAELPPKPLGPLRELELNVSWQQYHAPFIANQTTDNAVLNFDLSYIEGTFELSHAKLIRIPDETSLLEEKIERYYVDRKFNALGCRDRDYALSRAPNTFRILALGDSYTEGMGVHQVDVFTNQLERLLNERRGKNSQRIRYEVINCGISGYGTREERLFYELYLHKYKPDLILVVMLWNDDMSYMHEINAGYYFRPGPTEYLFYSLYLLHKYFAKRPARDFTTTVGELHKLIARGQRDGARTAVAVFRADEWNSDWKPLIEAVSAGLEGTKVPFLDLGVALLGRYSSEELMVHPVDGHPNEIAHKAAAEALLKFLEDNRMLGTD